LVLPVSLFAAGLKAIYLSGWQVAGDANTALQTYPDQSLYPADSVPKVVERINNAFQRADQIQHSQGKSDIHWFAPIVVSRGGGAREGGKRGCWDWSIPDVYRHCQRHFRQCRMRFSKSFP
jgi:isocitrate lyase